MKESIEIAYAEIFEILSYMPRCKVMQIPYDILKNFKENKKENYNSRIDKNDIYNKNNICKETLNILAYLNVKYWADDTKRKILMNQYRKNEIEQMRKISKEYPSELFEKQKNKNKEIIIVKEESKFKQFFKKYLAFLKKIVRRNEI